MVNFGIALSIAAPAIMLVLIIIGAVKAWPYRNVDREKFVAIYKPYKYWGIGLWLALDLIGIALIMNA